MLGFRLGDLNVYKTSAKSEVVIVRCHTTCQDQVDVIIDLFGKYGQVTVKKNNKNKSISVNCFLNNSFDFLLPKTDLVESWITENNKISLSFASGYTDAEANIGVYDGRARFKIDSYDRNTIIWFFNFFVKNKIFCPEPSLIGKKGQIYNKEKGYKYHRDLWRIRVSENKSLEKLLKIIKPYLKHKKRILDLDKCLSNINDRRSKKN